MHPETIACLLELQKLGAVSEEHVQHARKKLDQVGQMGRYALVGATAAPAIGALGDLVSGAPLLGGSGNRMRGALASSMKGARGASIIPVARNALDRQAQLSKKKD